jgi:hypothetical protein
VIRDPFDDGVQFIQAAEEIRGVLERGWTSLPRHWEPLQALVS